MSTRIEDYRRIEKAILYIEERFPEQPSLKQIATHTGLSEYHFQRLFTRWAGISPKRFVQYLTAQFAGELLQQRGSLLDVSMDAGLSSTSRLHDLMVNVFAMTPDEYRRHGQGIIIFYGWHDSPFGHCLIGITARGVCWLDFYESIEDIQSMRSVWQGAHFIEDPKSTEPVAEYVFADSVRDDVALNLHIKGTNLQIRVWEALLRIPFGGITSYSDIAATVDHPRAVRAVASAIGNNPIAYVIPCHRVIRRSGALGGYASGLARKQALLAWEAARHDVAITG